MQRTNFTVQTNPDNAGVRKLFNAAVLESHRLSNQTVKDKLHSNDGPSHQTSGQMSLGTFMNHSESRVHVF